MTDSSSFGWQDFRFGFWHPFGPYTGLTTQEIIDWKRGEVDRHGWTFWSFAHADGAAWLDLLKASEVPAYVLCSDSPAARDPDLFKGERLAAAYQYLGEETWQPMPDPGLMKVTNPFKRNGLALAFIVKRVTPIEPAAVPPLTIEWFAKGEHRWRSDRSLPTRGEFLVRRGGTQNLRRVSAVLELIPPYLAVLKPTLKSAV